MIGKIRKSLVHAKQQNGDIYVLERKTVFDPVKRTSRTLGTRIIGKIPAGQSEMVPMRGRVGERKVENPVEPQVQAYGRPSSSMKIVGPTALLMEAAKSSLIERDLHSIFPEKNANRILSLAIFSLLDESSLSNFNQWAENHEHPTKDQITSDEFIDLRDEIGSPEKCSDLFKARLAHIDDESLLAFRMETGECTGDKNKVLISGCDSETLRSTSALSVLVSEETHSPLLWQTIPDGLTKGSLLKSEVNGLEVGKTPVTVVSNEEDLYKIDLTALHERNINLIAPVDIELKAVYEVWDEYRNFYRDARYFVCDLDTYARTVPMALHVSKATGRLVDISKVTTETEILNGYLHLFKSTTLTQTEELDFYHRLTKFEEAWKTGDREEHSPMMRYFRRPPARHTEAMLERDYEEINRALLEKGFYALFTTKALDAVEAYRLYSGEKEVRRAFNGFMTEVLKTSKGNVAAETVNAHAMVHFVALTVLMEVTDRLREARAAGIEECLGLDFNALMEKFEDIRLIRVSGYDPRIGKVTEEERRIAEALGYPDLFDAVPAYL